MCCVEAFISKNIALPPKCPKFETAGLRSQKEQQRMAHLYWWRPIQGILYLCIHPGLVLLCQHHDGSVIGSPGRIQPRHRYLHARHTVSMYHHLKSIHIEWANCELNTTPMLPQPRLRACMEGHTARVMMMFMVQALSLMTTTLRHHYNPAPTVGQSWQLLMKWKLITSNRALLPFGRLRILDIDMD